MNKVFSRVSAVICTLALALSLVACTENADASATATNPDYTTLTTKIYDYQNSFGDFMNDESNNVYFKTSEGSTPGGNYCTASFLESEDGAFKKCSLEVTRDDVVECDEYFLVDESTVFIARAPISGNDSVYIEKYVIISGTLYQINDELQTVEPVSRPDALDLYLSFSELKSLYGNFDE
ncbi:hypothetical protein SAMN06296952_1929 [Oscillospiraceae bacterium]|nr:hypothetical protein SAMN06296952_1929 [Oscillospiraceae bacterium]